MTTKYTMTNTDIEQFKHTVWPDWLLSQFKAWMCAECQSEEVKREIAVFLKETREAYPEKFHAAFPQRDWSAQDDSLSPFNPPDDKFSSRSSQAKYSTSQ